MGRRLAAVSFGMVAALAVAPAGARAQSARGGDGDDADAPEPLRINREGEYGGVTPGSTHVDAGAGKAGRAHRHAKRKATISWLGFQPRAEGGGRLFVQLGTSVVASQRVDGAALIIQLDGARLGARNTRRALDVRFFASTVQEIAARGVSARRANTKKGQPRRKAGVELRVTFKDASTAAEAAASAATEPDGFAYLYFDFPEAPAARESIAPPKRRLPGDE